MPKSKLERLFKYKKMLSKYNICDDMLRIIIVLNIASCKLKYIQYLIIIIIIKNSI